MSTAVLSFDIGIRNLAWCLMTKEGENFRLVGWQNYDLLAGEGHETSQVKQTCSHCSAKAVYTSSNGSTCVRHCPVDKPALRDLSGVLLKKLPGMDICRALLQARGITGLKTKSAAVERLAQIYSLPIVKLKAKKAVETELTLIHESMRNFIRANQTLFSQATTICLENQPALKNPTMKSVQILLFATLRDLLQPNPPQMCLVHAGKKVQGEATGDAGYKARKDGSEARVKDLLQKKTVDSAKWIAVFESHKKRNDLADAFCMCVDKLVSGA